MKLTSQWELLLPGPEERALRPLVVHSGSFTTRTQLLPDFCVTSAVGSGTAFYHTAALGEGLRVGTSSCRWTPLEESLWLFSGLGEVFIVPMWLGFSEKNLFLLQTHVYISRLH